LTLFFILSPQMLTMMPSLRDFSKAPFILLLIFLLGLLIKYRFQMKPLAGLSLLLGLVNGIAMGFRQDALVFILPACVIVTVSVFRSERPFLKRRLLAPVLLLAAFFAAGGPQGFSMKRFASLGLEPGAYEPLASGSDNYTFAMLQDYYSRVNEQADTKFGFNSPGAEAAGRQFLLDMGFRFPGDLLARGYGALLRTLRYTDGVPLWHITGSPWQDLLEAYHEALKHHLHRYGPAYAVLTMLLISAHSLSLAFGLFIFVLYSCGYVSLQCEFRHAFHLSFVPLWILGFLFHSLISSVLGLRKDDTDTTVWIAFLSAVPGHSLSRNHRCGRTAACISQPAYGDRVGTVCSGSPGGSGTNRVLLYPEYGFGSTVRPPCRVYTFDATGRWVSTVAYTDALLRVGVFSGCGSEVADAVV